MKIEELVRRQLQESTRNTLPPLQRRVLKFFEQHKGEVFLYGDPDVHNELKEKLSAINWAIWALEKKGVLVRVKVGRRTYFGLPEDISRLKADLGKVKR